MSGEDYIQLIRKYSPNSYVNHRDGSKSCCMEKEPPVPWFRPRTALMEMETGEFLQANARKILKPVEAACLDVKITIRRKSTPRYQNNDSIMHYQARKAY